MLGEVSYQAYCHTALQAPQDFQNLTLSERCGWESAAMMAFLFMSKVFEQGWEDVSTEGTGEAWLHTQTDVVFLQDCATGLWWAYGPEYVVRSTGPQKGSFGADERGPFETADEAKVAAILMVCR